MRERYAKIATLQGGSCCGGGSSCCGVDEMAATSAQLGYPSAELSAVPEGSNLGLGCGNPQAIAALKPGETVLDLDAYGGCVAGAAQVGDVEELLRAAGFRDVQVRVKEESRAFIQEWFPGSGAEAYVASATIEARR